MSVTIKNNIVFGPEEENIPAHLSYGQFLYDKFKQGGDKIALVSALLFSYMFKFIMLLKHNDLFL